MSDAPLSLGFSPCPNDTFMFHALVHGPRPVHYELLDIEGLNRCAQDDPPRFDVSKLSIPALARRLDHYTLLDAGAALGRGCGPLVVQAAAGTAQHLDDLAGQTVAIPGPFTTAFMLLRMFGPADLRPVAMRFDKIMPAVAAGEVAAGLIIHESRFTYADHGLIELTDLGELWERDTGLPLPLGVIAARRSLGRRVISDIEGALRHSIHAAIKDPARSAAWVAEHAQEMDTEVCRQHIELYVNQFSLALGEQGRAAVERALQVSRELIDLEST